MRQVISFGLCMLLFSSFSCVNARLHDEHKAASLGIEFLGNIMDKRYDAAYNLFDEEFKVKVSQRQFVKRTMAQEKTLGNMLEARLDYFMIVGAEPFLELIFSCRFEKKLNVPVHLIARQEGKSYKLTVFDVGYNYKVFGDDEPKRPRLRVEKEYAISKTISTD